MQVIFQAVARAKSVKPIDVARALHGGTFDTILGKRTMRAEDHQMTAPNYFGYIGEQGGKLRPIITMSIPTEQASPPPSSECKMGAL